MKVILLAVDGMTLDKDTFDYALYLCHPIRAGLDILQIVRPRAYSEGLGRIKRGLYKARDLVEDTMVTATYAEAGAPELAENLQARAKRRFERIMPPHVDTAVNYQCVVARDNPEAVLKRYVDEHRNVIMAIYDSLRLAKKALSAPARQKGSMPGLLNSLSVPLVLVRET